MPPLSRLTNLLQQNLGFFDSMDQNLFRAFAATLLVWFGVKAALASASGHRGCTFPEETLRVNFLLDYPL